MEKIDIAGLKVDVVAKQEFLDAVLARIKAARKTFVITPYSEFLYDAFKDPALLDIFNSADFSLADGIGIFWAKRYLGLPLTAKSFYGKILQNLWQIIYTLAAVVFYPSWIKSVLPEKIVGADLVWDLAKLAADNNLSVYLLGGFGDTAKITAHRLTAVAKNDGRYLREQLEIVGWSNKNPEDLSIVNDINKVSADILFVAYGPVKQEKWIAENLKDLNVKLAIGVGGSFDYIAGVKAVPPKFIRYSGLEWLWRLITQPYRFKRIINATFGLISGLMRYKIFNSYPLRKNGVAVILNNDNEVFVGRKSGSRVDIITTNDKEKWKNYWQLPQGGIENKEDIVEAIMREAKEETGITDLQFLRLSEKTNTYIWNNALRKLRNNKKYLHKGQTQTIAYFKLGNSNQKITLPPGEEFIEYKWMSIADLNKVIHSERASLTKIVVDDLNSGLLKL